MSVRIRHMTTIIMVLMEVTIRFMTAAGKINCHMEIMATPKIVIVVSFQWPEITEND